MVRPTRHARRPRVRTGNGLPGASPRRGQIVRAAHAKGFRQAVLASVHTALDRLTMHRGRPMIRTFANVPVRSDFPAHGSETFSPPPCVQYPFVTDDLLIDKTLAGDTAAFGDLVQKYQDRLFHSISHVLGSVQDAEDVLQETFVQAFLKLESFQRTAAFYTWIYRIALDTAISLRRRKSARISIDQMHADTGQEPHDPVLRPTAGCGNKSGQTRYTWLWPRWRKNIGPFCVLREMDDCSYEEIAEILDLPIGTVRSRLHRARSQFKEQMKQVLQEDMTQP